MPVAYMLDSFAVGAGATLPARPRLKYPLEHPVWNQRVELATPIRQG